jgi:23S rRNA pseudouridine1911/1915/1917 synthase
VTKLYWGLVEGKLEPSEGTWTDWLRKIPEQARAETVEPHAPGGKEAVLRFRVMQGHEAATLVEFMPITGRMHQIRVQAAARGHPLVGDVLYGSTRTFGPAPESPRDRVIALHARTLTLLHPLSYEPITLTAPLPEYWQDIGVSIE